MLDSVSLTRILFVAFVALPVLPLATHFALAPSANAAQTTSASDFDEVAAVKAVVEKYIDAHRKADGDLMRGILMGHIHVVGTRSNGEAVDLNKTAYGDLIDNVELSSEIEAVVTEIDVVGNAATARLDFKSLRGARVTDFFVLYKTDAGWKISGKVFHSE